MEVSAIESAYREAVGHSIGTAQIYYVLHRHGWRKVVPRSRHPKKAGEEVIETSKNESSAAEEFSTKKTVRLMFQNEVGFA